jgi:hypothetical protein
MITLHPFRSSLSTIASVMAGLLLAVMPAGADNTAPKFTVLDYDAHLCRFAQQFLVNADTQSFEIIEQIGYGNGFHVIQMDVDAKQREVTIAMTTDFAEIDETKLATHVSCKTVDRERVNDVLGLQLRGPDHQCREVNEQTYKRALGNLSPEERSHYLVDGRQLTFGDDVIITTGGEWLPITMDAFIQPSATAGNDIVIRSPSVRVPWNRTDRQFYQGTQHCKLITLAAMERWMRFGAFSTDASLFPATELECNRPHSMTSTVGSCLFYFAPANSMFCQDYSGTDWNPGSAQDECGQRHASADALRAAKNRYAGTGGLFSTRGCANRDDKLALSGTCVFHCRQPDETLWHVTGPIDPRMTRGCDLFVPR